MQGRRAARAVSGRDTTQRGVTKCTLLQCVHQFLVPGDSGHAHWTVDHMKIPIPQPSWRYGQLDIATAAAAIHTQPSSTTKTDSLRKASPPPPPPTHTHTDISSSGTHSHHHQHHHVYCTIIIMLMR